MEVLDIVLIVLTAAAFLYFLYRAIKEHFLYEIIIVIWCPLFWLTYIVRDESILRLINTVQVVLLFLILISMFRKRAPEHNESISESNENMVELDETELEEEEESEGESPVLVETEEEADAPDENPSK